MKIRFLKKPLANTLDSFSLLTLLIFSFWLTMESGSRGFFGFDQSIIFDGAYRILCGQIPYKDFFMPVGPGTFWVQAVFFKLFGLTYSVYVATAAWMNVFATLFSVVILRLLFPFRRILSYVAGFLTAIWFYPLYGTTFFEQTAFFFCLAAMALIVSLIKNPSRDRWALPVAGGLWLFAFLCKQNAGAFIFPVYFLLLFGIYVPDWKGMVRGIGLFLAGVFISAAIFLLWVWRVSDFALFKTYFWDMALATGHRRFLADLGFGSSLARDLLLGIGPLGAGPLGNRIIVWSSFLAGLFVLFVRDLKKIPRRELLACFLCVYLPFTQNLFIRFTFNQTENGFSFLGIICACGMGLFFYIRDLALSKAPLPGQDIFASRRWKNGIVAVMILFFVSVAWRGIEVAWHREVQDVFRPETKFFEHLNVPGLEGLKWGEPTFVKGYRLGKKDFYRNVTIKARDFVGLFEYLKAKDENFFIFSDFTIFYALLHKPSPQPLLWFHKSLTYPLQGLDQGIVDGLRKNNVKIIILEEVACLDTNMVDFPVLKMYVLENFHFVKQNGIFAIYEMTSTGPKL